MNKPNQIERALHTYVSGLVEVKVPKNDKILRFPMLTFQNSPLTLAAPFLFSLI